MNRLVLDAATVRKQMADLLAAYPELAEDETLRADTFEAETDVYALVERALSERREAETMAVAIKEREGDLFARRARYERKAEAMKALIRGIMDAARLDKLTLPEATISITKARASVEVIVPEDLPQGFYALERKPDKKALFAALSAGDHVPGARLVSGSPSLVVRTK